MRPTPPFVHSGNMHSIYFLSQQSKPRPVYVSTTTSLLSTRTYEMQNKHIQNDTRTIHYTAIYQHVCSGRTSDKLQNHPTSRPATRFYGGLTASDDGGGLNGALVETVFGFETSGFVTPGFVTPTGSSTFDSAGGAVLLAFNSAERSTSAPLRMSSASISAACKTGQNITWGDRVLCASDHKPSTGLTRHRVEKTC